MPTENKIDCPALHKRMFGYPYGDRVPRTVRMLVTVTAERIPGVEMANPPKAKAGQTYPVWTNSYGAVVAVIGDGARLGLRPAEFEVESWHNLAAEPAPQLPEPIAWMVGTAIWRNKEEAERDAVATGLPMISFGPLADTGEVEALRGAYLRAGEREHELRKELAALRQHKTDYMEAAEETRKALLAQLAELKSSVREFLRIDGISVDGSAARNKALTMLHTALSG